MPNSFRLKCDLGAQEGPVSCTDALRVLWSVLQRILSEIPKLGRSKHGWTVQKSTKEASASAVKERKKSQMRADERTRAPPRKNCKQPVCREWGNRALVIVF